VGGKTERDEGVSLPADGTVELTPGQAGDRYWRYRAVGRSVASTPQTRNDGGDRRGSLFLGADTVAGNSSQLRRAIRKTAFAGLSRAGRRRLGLRTGHLRDHPHPESRRRRDPGRRQVHHALPNGKPTAPGSWPATSGRATARFPDRQVLERSASRPCGSYASRLIERWRLFWREFTRRHPLERARGGSGSSRSWRDSVQSLRLLSSSCSRSTGS
jgi:hypothetical protein